MTATTARRPQILPVSLVALATALLLAVALVPVPAQAHDTLISTDPEDGATVATSPEEITLTFSANILDVSPVVQITDENGQVIEEITPTVEGPDAIAAPSEPLPAGTHTIQWRVVSSDGHPIEGTFTITVEEGADSAAAGADGTEGSTEDGTEEAAADEESAASDGGAAADGGEGTTADDPDTTAADDEGAGSAMPPLLAVIGVVVVGVAIAVFFSLRRRS